jgi:hypothetical protein
MSLRTFRLDSRRRADRSGRRPPRTLLRLEQLEDRALPSGGFNFTPVAILGNPAPGPEGGTFTFDFETGGLNNKGQVVFTADLSEGAGDIGEGVFLGGNGGLAQIIRVGEAAPGGGTFGGFGSFSPDAINNSGDAAFAFGHDPLTLPVGTNAGVYLFQQSSGTVSAVVVPGVTPAPGGGIFQGAQFHPSLNNRDDLVFPGIVPADIGPGASIGLGAGIFLADKHGGLFDIARPGDPAPGGNTFDFAQNPAINNHGDIAFGAHIAADPCITLGQTLPVNIFCAESVYFRDGETGAIQSIAHQGTAIPDSAGGGTFDYAYAPVLNSRGQILFDAGLAGTSASFNGSTIDSQAIFLWSDGRLISIARQGDAMPGGGNLVSASFNAGNYDINSNGDVAFNALLDTGDEGVFLWSHGSLSLLAKTGTVIPGVGTIAGLDQYGSGLPNGYVHINDPGQVAFAAVLTDGTVALLLATPTGAGDDAAQVAEVMAAQPVAPNALLVSALQGAAAAPVAELGAAPHTAYRPTASSPADAQAGGAKLPSLPAAAEMPPPEAVDQLFASLPSIVLDDPLA